MIGAALLAHMVGDYLLQNHWMANAKTQRNLHGWIAAVVHGVTYSLPFWFITQSMWAIAVIAGTHVVIDHWRLARHVIWLRNQFAPANWRVAAHTPTGAPSSTPEWLALALLFVGDNVIHMLINLGAILWL